MKHSEEQIREIASWREDLVKQIGKHAQAIEILEKRILVLDSMLKESSFTKASSLENTKKIPEEKVIIEKKSIPITSGNDGKIIANAFVTPEQVEIILENGMEIAADVPPFKSFFIDRIIGEMKRKDILDADNGKIQKDSIIDYIINKNGSDIREIIIKNYKEKERVNEIINTAGWSFTRMLENIKK
jgi:superfamily II helicase